MKLTITEKTLIHATVEHVKKLRDHVNHLYAAGYAVGCERCEEINRAADNWIKSCEMLTKTESWIEWFVYENLYGANCLGAGYNGKTIVVHTLDDLFAAIEMRNV